MESILEQIPHRYIDFSNLVTISSAKVEDIVTIKGKVIFLKNQYTRRGLAMQIGALEDDTGKIQIVWFNQPFLVRSFYPGREIALSGKVSLFSDRPALISPEYEILTSLHGLTHTGRLVPIYPETKYISSKRIRTQIRKTFDVEIQKIKEFLPKEILEKYKLIEIKDAYKKVHFPNDLKEAEEGINRLAFNELLNLNLKSEYRKLNWKKNKIANKLTIDSNTIDAFINSLPFKLTPSQIGSIDEILKDMSQEFPMNRLLEGDVGSGKTVVAAIASFAAFTNGFQSVFMTPTQILAQQHFETLEKLFKNYKVRISLLTSGTKVQSLGRTDIFVGTHALIHKKVLFDKVSLVVIDEQHRFGVEQRAHLVQKSGTPHVLTMTATPIPRTVALTTYGDLDLSTLTEMPKGRQKITTWLVPQQKRERANEWIEKQRTQVFWVCPLIEESSKETMKDIKAVTTEFNNLISIFKNFNLGLLHGRMKSKEKQDVLESFRTGKLDILVTTPVVEVGIDIPNATIMVIEGAERFGLAQLHQLRGRVGRSKQKSYCLLFGKPSRRLTAMTKMHSGFELAELDLKLRGPGEVFGTAQSGFPQLKAASWSNYDLIKKTKDLAREIVNNPSKYPKVIANPNILS